MDRIPSGEVIVAAVLSSAVICAAPTVEDTANSTVIPMKAMVFFIDTILLIIIYIPLSVIFKKRVYNI
jgi:hypothetical protein